MSDCSFTQHFCLFASGGPARNVDHFSHRLFFMSMTATENILTQRLNDSMSRSHRSLQSLTVFHVYHSNTEHSYTETQQSNVEVTQITSAADCFSCLLQRLMRQRTFFHSGPTAKSDHSCSNEPYCQQTNFQMAGRGEN